MSDEHSGVSRRATLKNLGAAGAGLVLARGVAEARQAAPKPAGSAQDKQGTSAVDVAAGRFTKGHS